MALTDTEPAQAATDDTPPAIESRLGAWWVIAGLAVLLLVILGWKFMADPSISAPTRDPAWYTWRANVILQSNPVTVAQDLALKRFVSFLNGQVGKGNWAMVLTADHGAMPDPAVSGGFQIETPPIQAGINEHFDTDGDDTPVVDLVQPSQVFLNVDELVQNGFTVSDVARYVMTLTQAQTAAPTQTVDPATANDPVFQAAFPSALMQDLPCLPEAAA